MGPRLTRLPIPQNTIPSPHAESERSEGSGILFPQNTIPPPRSAATCRACIPLLIAQKPHPTTQTDRAHTSPPPNAESERSEGSGLPLPS